MNLDVIIGKKFAFYNVRNSDGAFFKNKGYPHENIT